MLLGCGDRCRHPCKAPAKGPSLGNASSGAGCVLLFALDGCTSKGWVHGLFLLS
jgi:hypothetical protein